MKINAFDVNLSSTRHFVETQQTHLTKSFTFGDLVDRKTDQLQTRPGTSVSLGEQFTQEVDKLRRIMDNVLAAFYARVSGGSEVCSCRINRVSPLFSRVPVQVEHTIASFQTEYEKTSFAAKGMVQTADGRQIDFSFEMVTERTFFQSSRLTQTQNGYALIDPLVVQTDVTVPALSEAAFSFDLDMDGDAEQIRLPREGMGILALDKNKDGVINDGSEVFGPATGDGFNELADYDLDGNLWIDENDAVFDELAVWESDGSGKMTLSSIKEAGIGAICLAAVDTPFSLTDEAGNPLARVKKSSIALAEDGRVGSVHEMDWMV